MKTLIMICLLIGGIFAMGFIYQGMCFSGLPSRDQWAASRLVITDLMPAKNDTPIEAELKVVTRETKERRIAGCIARGLPEGC